MDRTNAKQIVWAGILFAAMLVVLSACGGENFAGTGYPSDPPGRDPQDGHHEMATEIHTARFTQRTDILAVVDNSGSMSQERNAVKSSFGEFHRKLNESRLNDYRVAVVTTDAYTNEGQLVSFSGVDIVNGSASNSVALVEGLFGAVVDSPKSYWEQGIKASERALSVNGSRFLRPSTDLAIIYISDEQDYSCLDATGSPTGKTCPGMAAGGQPQDMPDPKPWSHVGLDYYRQFLQNLSRTVLVYSIVGTAARQCEELSKGARYETLQGLIGTGFTAPICNDQLVENFTRIGKAISARGDCYTLAHPALNLPDEFHVTLAGNPVPYSQASGFYFDVAGNAVCFSGSLLPPAGSELSITYPW